MNDAQRKDYLAWLNDAHALELSLVVMLDKQVKEASTAKQFALKERLQEHLDETKQHAQRVQDAIERNGGSVSRVKDFSAEFGAFVQGLGMSVFDDAMVKNIHGSYAAEHVEIATYTLIAAAARQYGDEETASMCDDILDDEIRMANWLMEQLPSVVEEHLAQTR